MWTMGTPGSLIFIGLVAVMVAGGTKRRREPTASIERFQRLDLTRAHDHHRRRGS